MKRFSFLIAVAAGLFGMGASAFAHDFWIEPDRFTLDEPGHVRLTLREGVDLKGNSLPYIKAWFEDFSRTDITGRQPVTSVLGNDPAAKLDLKPSLTLVGYQSRRNFVDLEPEKFASYLREEGLEYVFDLREARGEANENALEYFVRCAKSLLQTGTADASEIYSERLGYSLELVPGANPYRLSAGDTLPLTLLYFGEPIEGVMVRAFTKDLIEQSINVRTDQNGQVNLVLPWSGEWLVKAVYLRAVENDPKARWESFWASLTFELG